MVWELQGNDEPGKFSCGEGREERGESVLSAGGIRGGSKHDKIQFHK